MKPNQSTKLLDMARTQCLSYVLNLPGFQPQVDRLLVLLVGSVATGLWREDSDIDIAVICEDEIYQLISRNENWENGRPSEIEIDGVQLHYYAITFEKIEQKLKQLDDIYLYVYSNVVVMHDPANLYQRHMGNFISSAQNVRKARIEGKLDMLLRRATGVQQCIKQQDIVVTGCVCFEIVKMCLKICALLDDIPFDSRKRFFITATRGRLGGRCEGLIRQLICDIGTLGTLRESDDFEKFNFPRTLDKIVNIFTQEAAEQGFRIGLQQPDHRHIET